MDSKLREESWSVMYGMALSFHERTGGRARTVDAYPLVLGHWLGSQLRCAWKGLLTPAQAQLLRRLGLEVFTKADQWQERLAALRAFKEKYGHAQPSRNDPRLNGLAKWLDAQRKAFREGRLDPEQLEPLLGLGVGLERKSLHWEQRCRGLEAALREQGLERLPGAKGHWNGPERVKQWVWKQQRAHRRRKLTAEQEQTLVALGVEWATPVPGWEERYAEVVAFRQARGHCRPADVPGEKQLHRWLDAQRVLHKQGLMLAERARKLEALGVVWRQIDEQWKEQCAALKAHWEQHGNYLKLSSESGLDRWFRTQRRLAREGRLLPERRARLDELSALKPLDYDGLVWEQRFAELVAFRQERGHCKLSSAVPEEQRLYAWLSCQRLLKRMGRTGAERTKRLEELGVVWDQQQAIWDNRYKVLEAYHERHGDCRVSFHQRKLYQWLNQQKSRARAGRLEPARRARLEALGWSPGGEPAPEGGARPAASPTVSAPEGTKDY